jgi:hypothetical protein
MEEFMKYLMLLSLMLAFNVHAEIATEDGITQADEALHTPAMDIEGQYHVKEETKAAPAAVVIKEEKAAPVKVKKVSQSERLKMYRERLEERNRIMVEKKMEQIRFQQELALARKLEQSMNQTLKAIDNVKN